MPVQYGCLRMPASRRRLDVADAASTASMAVASANIILGQTSTWARSYYTRSAQLSRIATNCSFFARADFTHMHLDLDVHAVDENRFAGKNI